jgi:hypothetical protein
VVGALSSVAATASGGTVESGAGVAALRSDGVEASALSGLCDAVASDDAESASSSRRYFSAVPSKCSRSLGFVIAAGICHRSSETFCPFNLGSQETRSPGHGLTDNFKKSIGSIQQRGKGFRRPEVTVPG